VLAFKRSLSAGILDGGTGEISLGGSRLSRFMKDVENVTGTMGEGETVTPAEEMINADAAPTEIQAADAVPDEIAGEGVSPGGGPRDEVRGDGEKSAANVDSRLSPEDPWSTLLQIGMQFAAALGAAASPSDSADSADRQATPHPWIERDPQTGARNLKVPLPPPETARQIADALSLMAQALRGRGS
jgi:hypothetical protein